MEQQRLRTIKQKCETQLNAKQETNQAIPQTSLKPSIPQIPADTSKPPPNINQTQLSSTVTHLPQNHTTTFGFNNTNLYPNSSAIYTNVNRSENSNNGTNSTLERTLHLSNMAAREHYISNAKTCDGKDSKLFQNWLDDVSRLSLLSGKTCNKVAVATSKGPLHKYTQELVNLGNP